jgi:2-dehydro-3-deoxygluconokinase
VEGIGTGLIVRLPGRLPDLYVIQTDARGERHLSYWRDQAAARSLFEVAETPGIIEALASYDLISRPSHFLGLSRSAPEEQVLILAYVGLRSVGLHREVMTVAVRSIMAAKL